MALGPVTVLIITLYAELLALSLYIVYDEP